MRWNRGRESWERELKLERFAVGDEFFDVGCAFGVVDGLTQVGAANQTLGVKTKLRAQFFGNPLFMFVFQGKVDVGHYRFKEQILGHGLIVAGVLKLVYLVKYPGLSQRTASDHN